MLHTHLSGILLWEQSALFHGFFSQHDWLSDYFHFCLCWRRWQKDCIPVGTGWCKTQWQIRRTVNHITCFAMLLSSKTSFHGPGFCPGAPSSALRQVLVIHSCSSSSERNRKRSPDVTIAHPLFELLGSCSNNFSLENKPRSEPLASLRTYFCF